jgi:hypothetical protein
MRRLVDHPEMLPVVLKLAQILRLVQQLIGPPIGIAGVLAKHAADGIYAQRPHRGQEQ